MSVTVCYNVNTNSKKCNAALLSISKNSVRFLEETLINAHYPRYPPQYAVTADIRRCFFPNRAEGIAANPFRCFTVRQHRRLSLVTARKRNMICIQITEIPPSPIGNTRIKGDAGSKRRVNGNPTETVYIELRPPVQYRFLFPIDQ